MFIGNVTARAIGKKSPGLALGTETFIAAGTAIYEALADKMENMNLLLMSCVTKRLRMATAQPLNKGITIEKITGNQPKAKNVFNFFPLVTPMSKRKIARNFK